jgi:hypothetical protein
LDGGPSGSLNGLIGEGGLSVGGADQSGGDTDTGGWTGGGS